MWICYLLACKRQTYIGMTNNPDRRLRQHNGEIAGGAKATRGRVWRRIAMVEGFVDARAARQYEYAWKRTRAGGKTPLERRLSGAVRLLTRGKSTKTSRPFATYPRGPPILVHDLT